MISFAFNNVNGNGIPCIEVVSITESSTIATYNFNPSPFPSSRFSGLIAVKIEKTPTTTSLPVNFSVPSVAGSSIALTTFGGTVVTGASLTTGIHLVFYDRPNNILQLIV